ncbi:translation initiation factor IF-2-like [Oryx dammah]|uniref:translation initiation factor IF-2-like n=1 Tax=Oryx dammah TaxID=59534 RepID=UPI001A9A96D7|nr:translation initiation factor IF-2-like [Oryx dammah]
MTLFKVSGIFHVAQEGRPCTARKPKVPLGSYVPPSPAPASAAAFLTEIVQAAPSRPARPSPGRVSKVAASSSPLLARPGLALRRGPGASARPPEAPGPERQRGPPAPRKSEAHSPTAPRGTRAPAPPTLAARRPRTQGLGGLAARAQKSLSSPIGGTARVPGSLNQPGRTQRRLPAKGRGRGGRKTRGPPAGEGLRRDPEQEEHERKTRHPRRLRPRGGPALTGEGVQAPRRPSPTPPAQPPGGDDVTRSRPAARPRPTRRSPPPDPQYLQISPGQRLAPRPSAPSPSRGHRRPAGPPPPPDRVSDRAALTGLPGRGGATTGVAAPSRTTFLCCRSFGGGEGDGGKVRRWARRGPRRPSGAAQSVQAAGSRPAVRAAAATHSGLWGPRPRRRLLGSCALSSREPHIPTQEAAPRTRPAPPPPLPGHAPSPPARARRTRPRRCPRA